MRNFADESYRENQNTCFINFNVSLCIFSSTIDKHQHMLFFTFKTVLV